jgi:hypothetical protein
MTRWRKWRSAGKRSFIQFRLARENDLQEFAPRSFEIEQQANLIESLQRETLGFIKDKDR